MERETLRDLLEAWWDRYDRPEFIAPDPVSIPHRYSLREDIEISGFLAATIAWGNRTAILRSAGRMMRCMDDAPWDFTLHASERELVTLERFVHRTFNGDDLRFFVLALRRFYAAGEGLGGFFERRYALHGDLRPVLSEFRRAFFTGEPEGHCGKHLASIDRGASCKRLNMFLRWMIRRDPRGVDFGLWRGIPASALYLPLDVHSGRMARELGLLDRRQDDWRAVEEVTASLRSFDAADPVRFDYALFGAGISLL